MGIDLIATYRDTVEEIKNILQVCGRKNIGIRHVYFYFFDKKNVECSFTLFFQFNFTTNCIVFGP